jgi:hypothetical protein
MLGARLQLLAEPNGAAAQERADDRGGWDRHAQARQPCLILTGEPTQLGVARQDAGLVAQSAG